MYLTNNEDPLGSSLRLEVKPTYEIKLTNLVQLF